MTQYKCSAFLFLFLVSCGARSRISSTCVASNYSSEDANKALESYLKKPQAVSSGGYLKVKSNEVLKELFAGREKTPVPNSTEDNGTTFCTAFFEPEIKEGKRIVRVWTDIDCHKNWPTLKFYASVYSKGKYLADIPLTSEYLENKIKAFEIISEGFKGENSAQTQKNLVDQLYKFQDGQKDISSGEEMSFRRKVFETSLSQKDSVPCTRPSNFACQNPLRTTVEEFAVASSATAENSKAFDELLKNYQEQKKSNSIPAKLKQLHDNQKLLISEITKEEREFPVFDLVENVQKCTNAMASSNAEKTNWICQNRAAINLFLQKFSKNSNNDYFAEFKKKSAASRNSELFFKFKKLLTNTLELKTEAEKEQSNIYSILSNVNYEPTVKNFHFASVPLNEASDFFKYSKFSPLEVVDIIRISPPNFDKDNPVIINLLGHSFTGSMMSINTLYPIHSLSLPGGKESGGFPDPIPPENITSVEGNYARGILPPDDSGKNPPNNIGHADPTPAPTLDRPVAGVQNPPIPPSSSPNTPPQGKPKPVPIPTKIAGPLATPPSDSNPPLNGGKIDPPSRIAENDDDSMRPSTKEDSPRNTNNAQQSVAAHNSDMGCK